MCIENYGNYTGDSFINILGDIITTIIGYLFVQKTIYGSILFLTITEILIPYKATILQLSFGSLLKQKIFYLVFRFYESHTEITFIDYTIRLDNDFHNLDDDQLEFSKTCHEFLYISLGSCPHVIITLINSIKHTNIFQVFYF